MNAGSKHMRGRGKGKKDHKRSPMNRRLPEHLLMKACTDGLARLYRFLMCPQKAHEYVPRLVLSDGSSEPEGQFRARIIKAIMRREKQLAQGQD